VDATLWKSQVERQSYAQVGIGLGRLYRMCTICHFYFNDYLIAIADKGMLNKFFLNIFLFL